MKSLNDLENNKPESDHFSKSNYKASKASQSNYKDDLSEPDIINILSKKHSMVVEDTEVDEKMLKLKSFCEEDVKLW